VSPESKSNHPLGTIRDVVLAAPASRADWLTRGCAISLFRSASAACLGATLCGDPGHAPRQQDPMKQVRALSEQPQSG
jgi:hypothetical protein